MKTRLPIFKAGKHRAMNGQVYNFTAADLDQIVAAYDPALARAPHVIGHPKTDDPAWGWVKSVGIDQDGLLYCEHDQVDPAFAEGVAAGRWDQRSCSFYGPNDAGNPKPGGYYLKHVGWLGAQAPAVKGLGPAFSEDTDGGIEFGTADGYWVKDVMRGLRDWIIDKFSLEEADKVVPSWAIDNIDRPDDKPLFAEEPADTNAGGAADDTVPAGEADDQVAAFAERQAALDALAADLAAREAAVTARETAAAADQVAFAETERTEVRKGDAALIKGLVEAGKLPPGRAGTVTTVLAVLSGDTSISFAEGEPDAAAQFRDLLSGLGDAITFAEVAPGSGAAFAENQDAERIRDEIHRLQAEASSRGETLSASQAAGRLGR